MSKYYVIQPSLAVLL